MEGCIVPNATQLSLGSSGFPGNADGTDMTKKVTSYCSNCNTEWYNFQHYHACKRCRTFRTYYYLTSQNVPNQGLFVLPLLFCLVFCLLVLFVLGCCLFACFVCFGCCLFACLFWVVVCFGLLCVCLFGVCLFVCLFVLSYMLAYLGTHSCYHVFQSAVSPQFRPCRSGLLHYNYNVCSGHHPYWTNKR